MLWQLITHCWHSDQRWRQFVTQKKWCKALNAHVLCTIISYTQYRKLCYITAVFQWVRHQYNTRDIYSSRIHLNTDCILQLRPSLPDIIGYLIRSWYCANKQYVHCNIHGLGSYHFPLAMLPCYTTGASMADHMQTLWLYTETLSL